MKLRSFRQEKGFGLKQLAALTGLSASYINEIEKRKKVSKSRKNNDISWRIRRWIRWLGFHQYDWSARSNLGTVFSSSVLGSFPFQLFGITFENVMELFTPSHKKAAALISTLMEIPRAYNMNVEQFFLASLRPFQEMHSNYFEEVEELAEKFVLEQKWTRLSSPTRAE